MKNNKKTPFPTSQSNQKKPNQLASILYAKLNKMEYTHISTVD